MAIRDWFTRHPRSVGETYTEHFGVAVGFGGKMLLAGLTCLVHAVLPSLFERTASRCIDELHDRMVVSRARQTGSATGHVRHS